MKFLTDVNASGIVAHWLLEEGFDTVRVGDRNPCMDDEEILRWANSEHRIIVTTDKDFEELIWLGKKKHSGILRLENVPRVERLQILKETIANYATELRSGAIVIATTHKFRVRKLYI